MRARRLIPAMAAAVGVVLTGCSAGDTTDDADVVTVTVVSDPTGEDPAGSVSSGSVTVPGSASGGGSSPASSAPGSSPARTTSTTAEPGASSSTTPPKKTAKTTTTSGTDGRPASNIPMRKLKPGEKPPQFIIFSFDGAGSHEKWNLFMDAAKPTDSRFVGFLTGIYLVETANKQAYTGPGHSPGKSSVSFGGTKEEIVTEIEDLNKAYAAGHEIGTHYNGHFCAGAEPSGKDWDTAAWNSELDQFMKFVTDYKKINNWGDEVPDLKVTADDIKGGRTPCLEGVLKEMAPAWKKHGLTYDSSLTFGSGITWPDQREGIWEFPMPYVYSPGFQGMVMAMDYNFWVKFNGGKEQPETAPELRSIVTQTYDYMYDQAYNGNRAPVLIANHFNAWNGDSFNVPALAFMKDKCGQPETYCATYSDVIQWMELQDPAVLKELQQRAPVAAGPAS
ncbi:polysaccharide deacetylase family protein [Nakamurella lactea]|uniref:polysaccharide deacetylase n=1 Tax=Nakamurella lactea TaxID=459515 RepID=UPI000425FC16|nr:polysaccharide deacetylase [Nakamurella lactea]